MSNSFNTERAEKPPIVVFDKACHMELRLLAKAQEQDLLTALNRALNCWPEAPKWLADLSDKLSERARGG